LQSATLNLADAIVKDQFILNSIHYIA